MDKNEKPYISSMINTYGDTERVKQDAATLLDIISRQGDSLLVDMIAENCGAVAIKFNMTTQERMTLRDSLISELRSALNERL